MVLWPPILSFATCDGIVTTRQPALISFATLPCRYDGKRATENYWCTIKSFTSRYATVKWIVKLFVQTYRKGGGKKVASSISPPPITLIQGVNWYGAETEAGAVQGLDKRTMDDIFAFLQEKNFNALRLPFSLRFSLTYDSPVPGSETFLDADLHGMTKGELFRRIVEKAGEHKMVVLLDMHRLNEVVIPQVRFLPLSLSPSTSLPPSLSPSPPFSPTYVRREEGT